MNWQERIKNGMELIMEGCKENPMWTNCHDCPFDVFCTSIQKDEEHDFSTPDSYEAEGFTFDDEA